MYLQLVTSYAATGSHFMILLFQLLSHNVVQNGRNKERLFGFPQNERWDRACFLNDEDTLSLLNINTWMQNSRAPGRCGD
jgi:hypothetical protein